MSHDRVQFKLDTTAAYKLKTAFQRAFGVKMPSNVGVITIQCRPSQFARFLIYRNEEGLPNSFKELEPVLVPANSQRFLDVAGNPAEVTC